MDCDMPAESGGGGGGGGYFDDSSSTSNSNKDSITLPYLRRMIYYASALAHSDDNNGSDGNMMIGSNNCNTNTASTNRSTLMMMDGESLANLLAQELLSAADPTNLRSSLSIPSPFLLPGEQIMTQYAPMMENDDGDESDEDQDDDEDDAEINFLPYKIDRRQVRGGRPRNPTRIDALRSLLRSLAPVAMDVAARVASHVLLTNRAEQRRSSVKKNDIIRSESDGDSMEGIESSTTTANTTAIVIARQERLRAFVLFGYWLPFAPQLAPILSDLFSEFHRFQGDDNGCPLALLPLIAKMKLKIQQGKSSTGTTTIPQDHSSYYFTTEEAETAVVVSEAARDLLNVYCNKRYEHTFVRKWWNWDSCLFLLIHAGDYYKSGSDRSSNQEFSNIIDSNADGDVVMASIDKNEESNTNSNTTDKLLTFFIGGYSPETNAPHCATQWKDPTFQMKWFASRAVGALFALRPLPLSKFLKALKVYENAVPFVRHPWTVDMEDARHENNLLRGVSRVVLQKVENVNIKFGHDENEAFAYYDPYDPSSDSSTSPDDIPNKEEEDKELEDEHTFQLPSIDDVRKTIPLHPSLVHVGRGILLPRRGSIASYDRWCQFSSLTHETPQQEERINSSCCFVPTHTTMKNMSLLGIAMSSDPHPPPILVCGPPGSGKSSLVRELSRLCASFASEMGQSSTTTTASNHSCQEDELLELHVDEETDSKTLLGSFVATDIPGEFVWMAGPLTSAARLGRWVLIEDVDKCPEEIQAALIRLFEERILPLGVGKEEKCHPRFRLFGTLVTSTSNISNAAAVTKTRRKSSSSLGTGTTRILHPNLWRKVHVDPLPFIELREVGRMLHPNLPYSVADAVLDVVRKLDKSGRGDDDNPTKEPSPTADSTTRFDKEILGHGARHASVRDFIKLLSRISASIHFEPGCDYTTEAQRLICLADTVDVFALSCPHVEKRRDFICHIGAPAWGLTADAAMRYIENRIPTISCGAHDNRRIEIGRARLLALRREDDEIDLSAPGKRRNFAETNHALRLIESIAVCASQNEPALLVGETGCGKTTLVQRLANLTGRTLIVQNLSLQTDSTDLLGGYKPLEMRHVARGVYDNFVDLFVSSFSRSQNAQFLNFVLTAFEKNDWKKLAQCFLKAASMGENKMRELSRNGKDDTSLHAWSEFRLVAERFERQRIASDSGMAFLFTEGALVDAIRTGKWVLLDEINLASSETLQRLCGLLDDSHGSITLTEKGDAEAVSRHPDFRLFAAMNPATDAGKKDLPSSIRSRFTEIYVDELVDPVQLRSVAARYLEGAVTTNGVPLEHSESVTSSVEVYLKCRLLSDQSLVDGGGQKPRYTMRTLCRTLSAARNLIIQQRFAPQRAILEGFQLAFEGSLDLPSRDIINKQFTTFLPNGITYKERDHPGRRPDGRNGSSSYVLINPFWIKSGKEDQLDWADPTSSSNGKPKFVLTPSATSNLRRLCQAVASGPWSILLEGPTSAGKTTLVEYLAARCGHKCVRINNHEHTDIQEYTGSYAADSKGNISFQEGILVQALRRGHWVILDELNLAPSDVLEALNRLLDDNRELYLPEINEAVKPHDNFRLFATQNPAGAYGGRKPLSRAFRNRFVEIHMSDIPEDEMIIILERRCGCPPSHAKLLVNVMKSLRQRRSRTGIFRGKDGLITPRDLLRWAGRGSASKIELAEEGYMLLAERLRIDEEKDVVRSVIEKELKVTINMAEVYYGEKSEGRHLLEHVLPHTTSLSASGLAVNSIAPTQSMMRLLTLVMRCVKQKEPVLLVGDTGCGKTTVVQLLSIILQRQLTVINCHASTETGDILGGFRPVRARQTIAESILEIAAELVQNWTDSSFRIDEYAPSITHQYTPSQQQEFQLSQESPKEVIEFLRKLVSICRLSNETSTKSSKPQEEAVSAKKKRRLSKGNGMESISTITKPDQLHCQKVEHVYIKAEHLYQKYVALFEWADGPLVCSMKDGSLLLLDEMNLAEDAVLERLNSVLEPGRTLTLAERGGDGPSCVHESDCATPTSSEIKANDEFRIFATMNPGGDFGKRELSPALRSRFTEIWVPPVSQLSDIDLVLEKSFLSSMEQRSIHDASDVSDIMGVRRMMLDYFNWFNVDVCEDPNTFCNEFKLSLRDVLSWARFIADVYLKSKKVDLYSAYAHGASLMHLDGLGLGTGVSNQDATTTRNKAKEFLLRQISYQDNMDTYGFNDALEGNSDIIMSTSDCFGITPFTIPIGNNVIPDNLGFNLSAPTTGLNLRRVLRGMQISKPILLEGSPGVGKTSLIMALAKASGHHLVRINLSEQTDVSDLMGTDVPYSGENDTGGTSSTSSFRWSDGVLLKAIKRGDWVLLDELNLASQSVLEGLNSCLDHRASVYIPELGRSFECPPTFRIFAAQNPLAQGGGRKGLPKSFLNRFTKVYIEALTKQDIFSIAMAQFPSVPIEIMQRMIDFNDGVQRDIDSRLYGQYGSPWEFNLRDIFRWCQLMQSSDCQISIDSTERYADMLYTQRLRTGHDRSLIGERFINCFGTCRIKSHPKLEVTENHVRVGHTTIDRFSDSSHWSAIPTLESEPDVSESLLRPMEAIACCVRMNWPCLLVGPSASGKSALLRTLADICNVHIETLAMSSSTDVTELIGCFEQTDSTGEFRDLLLATKRLYEDSCLIGKVDVELLHTINNHFEHLSSEKLKKEELKAFDDSAIIHVIGELIDCFERISRLFPEVSESFSCYIASSQQYLTTLKRSKTAQKAQPPFRWIDGILVKAMERGYWLHLENVNFCPSSVLDRLNPLMEFGGKLVVTECGLSDDDQNSKPKVIKPHPNFRLFLSMNHTSHGEVSRAMRNRCVEVCVLPPVVSDAQALPVIDTQGVNTLDTFTALWDAGVRSQNAGSFMVDVHMKDYQKNTEHQEETHSMKALKEWGQLFIGLLNRGLFQPSLSISCQILYDLNDQDTAFDMRLMPSTLGLVASMSTRGDLGCHPNNAEIGNASRLLKMMASASNDRTTETLMQFMQLASQSYSACRLSRRSHHQTKLKSQAVSRLVEFVSLHGSDMTSFIDGYCNKTATEIKLVARILADAESKCRTIRNHDTSHQERENRSLRVPQLLDESMTYLQLNQVSTLPPPGDMSVIAVSYLMHSKRIDASAVFCPITPLLFPFFQTMDLFLMRQSSEDPSLSASVDSLLLNRDRLWRFLKRIRYLGGRTNSKIGFKYLGFVINYCWVKKSFTKFRKYLEASTSNPGGDSHHSLHRLMILFECIDETMQECTGGSISSSDLFWKKGGHPILPSKRDHFEEMSNLNDISTSCTLANDELLGFARMVSGQLPHRIDMKQLITLNHPSLFVQKQFSTELLGAIATTFWAFTDETRNLLVGVPTVNIANQVLSKSFTASKADFIANIQLATIDTSIRTIDNALDLDSIKSIIGEHTTQSQNSDGFLTNLLTRFGEIQATQLGEIFCILEEAALIGELTKILRQSQWPVRASITVGLQSLRQRMKSFIGKTRSHTLWSVVDLRPYQTLLWLLDSSTTTDDALHQIMRSILHRILFSHYNHMWSNTYNDLDCISPHLAGPSFWNKDEDDTPKMTSSSLLGQSAKSVILSSCAGPTRSGMNIDRSAMFRLLRMPSTQTSSAYMTMENFEARQAQARKLLPLFASQEQLDTHANQAEMIKYLFWCVLDVFQEVFGQVHIDLKNILDSHIIEISDIETVFKKCENMSIRSITSLAIALIENIHGMNKATTGSSIWKRFSARAWIYLGLIRLHLTVPSAPIDPGQKPAEKVVELDWFLQDIRTSLMSHSLHHGLSRGDFAPDDESTRLLFALSDISAKKRANQEKKIIERPSHAPPFHDLFREIHHFCKTVASPGIILGLIDLIEKDCGESRLRSYEVNWQCSASSFCARLTAVYSMYEDITIPCINEIRSIQRGLRELSLAYQDECPQARLLTKAQDELLKYPLGNIRIASRLTEECYSSVLNGLLERSGVDVESGKKQDTALIHKSIQLATLLRLHISQLMSCHLEVGGGILQEVNSIFSSLAQLPETGERDISASSNEANKESETEERELREFFPDHSAEFERIVASSVDDIGDEEIEPKSKESCADVALTHQLSDVELSLAVSLHAAMFSGRKDKIDDNIRLRAFRSSYVAASHLGHFTEWMTKSEGDYSCRGSHILALALKCSVSQSGSSDDFHNDPFPAEAIRADLPLRNLLIRVGQLLRAFPGHAVLVALGQVVERVRQLDIQAVPLGKVMSGLEVILRKSQDWEQHASQHVTLGKPLKDIGALVASWRKIELQSWSRLLSLREQRRIILAKRHWLRVYNLIHGQRGSFEPADPHRRRRVLSPHWVWKGHQELSVDSMLGADTKGLDDLAKVLDTFLLTSNIAEFVTRLGLIENFAKELENELKVSGMKRHDLAMLLQSLCNHYSRFAPLVIQTKDALREPIEKCLKDEVKLAKWDEQSYYSLAESSEKNHRKLMKYLRDYDKALDTTVLSILEKNYAFGVRSSHEAQAGDHEPITTIPGDSALFPELSRIGTTDESLTTLPRKNCIMDHACIKIIDISSDDCLAAGLVNSVDKYVLKIKQYALRMESMIEYKNSYAYDAANLANEMSDAVFNRINTLRQPKTTKPMKQRALVDLFKCLKEQGYSSMKWSVPSNIRAPFDMLQLPIPAFGSNSPCDSSVTSDLERGESYFHRCQVEVSRLRFEIGIIGSQYMSLREMTLMQGYSDYILFMICQQRCMVAMMLQAVADIDTLIHSYGNLSGTLPMRQTELSKKTISFETSLSILTEDIRQLILLVKSSLSLFKSEAVRGHAHDIIAILVSCASTIEEDYSMCHGSLPITSDQIKHIREHMASILDDIRSKLASCMEICDDILPTTILDSCMMNVTQALNLALSFDEEEDVSNATSAHAEGLQFDVISSLVQSTLIAVQSMCPKKSSDATSSPYCYDGSEDQTSPALCRYHREMINEFKNLRLDKIHNEMFHASRVLICLHDNVSKNEVSRSLYTRATANSFSLVKISMQMIKAQLGDAVLYYMKHSKFLYVLLRVFRALISKGYCSDDVSEGGDGSGNGDASEMKFEDDVEGTGMGEGEGKNDVTDELENEEQLLGLKGDDSKEAPSQERKELKEDEVDTGMEMEADFEGEKYDLPDKPDEENNDANSENEEELDREMGNGEDPNEQVVDEKMWDNDEDDLQEMQQENEKFEENSKMAGDQIEDEMRTGEEEKDDEGKKRDDSPGQDVKQNDTDQENRMDTEADETEDRTNDDTEDKYEEKNVGVDVRNDDISDSGGGEEEKESEDGVDMNDLNLDDGEEDGSTCSADDGAGNVESDPCETPIEEEIDPDAEKDFEDCDEDKNELDAIENVGEGGVVANENEDPNEPEENNEHETHITPPTKNQYDSNDALGVAAADGQDTVAESNDEKPDPQNSEDNSGGEATESKGADETSTNESKGAGGTGTDDNWKSRNDEEGNNESQTDHDDIPNPFRSPGDADKFWHKKLHMLQDRQKDDQPSEHSTSQEQHDESKEKDGQFEYTQDGEDNRGQVLGIAEDDQAKQLEDHSDDDFESCDPEMEKKSTNIDDTRENQDRFQLSSNGNKESTERAQSVHKSDDMEEEQNEADDESESEHPVVINTEEEIVPKPNRAITDSAQIRDIRQDDEADDYGSDDEICEMDITEQITIADLQQAREYWQTIQSDTNNLSRRLCEKLRLVMEPLVATKLRGDYRTGKRVNMKRIIGYIASGYRKDKIWLRRTKPAKRDYRVLIAVDDSESMQKSRAGDMALRALSTLANGMSQLEIGQLGIASFGEDMKLLHPFNIPFTAESGVNIVSNFKFDAKRTRTALCVESAIAALEGAHTVSSSMQLVFMISDGRIERDSRSKLRRLIRQMSENNMLMVMIIVEGEENNSQNKSDGSILSMKEVSFVNGKPKIKHFIEDYPFPYYIVVGDLAALPEILGDCLRQWFEMLSQIQNAV